MGREIKGRTRTPSRGTSRHPSTSTAPPHSPPLPLLSSLLFSLLLSSRPTLTHEPISASRSPPHDNTTPTPTHLSLTAVTAPLPLTHCTILLPSSPPLPLFFSPLFFLLNSRSPHDNTTSPMSSSQLPLPLPPHSPTSTTTNPMHRSPSLLPTSSFILFSSFFLLNSCSPHDNTTSPTPSSQLPLPLPPRSPPATTSPPTPSSQLFLPQDSSPTAST